MKKKHIGVAIVVFGLCFFHSKQIFAQIPYAHPDRFPGITFEQEKSRLDGWALEFKKHPNQEIYLVVHPKEGGKILDALVRLKKSVNYLTHKWKIPKTKINHIIGGELSDLEMEIFLLPKIKKKKISANFF